MSEKITSPVHRGLEAKTKILGMEAYDLFFVLILACVMDLIVGHTVLREYFVFLLPAIFAIGLFLSKRGRPERYLLHLLRYYCSPGRYSAGAWPKDEALRKRSFKK